LGYLEGSSRVFGYFTGGQISGMEIVYDYATMSRARFKYEGTVAGLILGAGWSVYVGNATGFKWDNSARSFQIEDDYGGPFKGVYIGGGIPLNPMVSLGGGIGTFHSPDWELVGEFTYYAVGFSPIPVEVVAFATQYEIEPGSIVFYADESGNVNTSELIGDILSGDQSPIPLGPVPGFVLHAIGGSRAAQITNALREALLFELYWNLTHPQGDSLDGP
jgi:hypothetical protein